MVSFVLAIAAASLASSAAELVLPQRPANAPSGSEFVERIKPLDLNGREKEIREQFTRGNVPNFWRRFVSVTGSAVIDGRERKVEYFVSPDYLAIGSDIDYFLVPVSPAAAQSIADAVDCILPTSKMVDDIYAAAPVKLAPTPIPPSATMTTVPVFQQHNQTVHGQRALLLEAHPFGALVAGHKKDIVLTRRLTDAPNKVAIYGWHQTNSQPIQPLYLGHTSAWVDYSHGARLIQKTVLVDGIPARIDAVLLEPKISRLLTREGPILQTRYSVNAPLTDSSTLTTDAVSTTNQFGEHTIELLFDRGVRVAINSPRDFAVGKPVRLVLYALPNGNTIEQTMGRKLKPGDDWHFDIQHIGAQARWLRQQQNDASLVIAYLECAEKSWPTWRRKNDPNNERIPVLVETLRGRYSGVPLSIVLTGHSGGGSFTFGFLNGVQEIPNEVERIAFLDSNYAYDPTLHHGEKLSRWLAASEHHYLSVLAYHDSIALLDGKTFVSEKGGTWGRSQAMISDLARSFSFERNTDSEWQHHTALDGRIKFFLKENPAKAVLHTRQVEWNGFIHAMVVGTEMENKGYSYFGTRAYEEWIER